MDRDGSNWRMADCGKVPNRPGKIGEWGGARTRDHRIKSPMLYHLSYPSTLVVKSLLELGLASVQYRKTVTCADSAMRSRGGTFRPS